MIRFITLSALLFGFASCKKDEKAEPAPVTETAPAETATPVAQPVQPAPATAVFAIKAAKLSFEVNEKNPDGPKSLSLDDSGNVMANDKLFAKLSADGKMTYSDGKLMASVSADGTLTADGIDEAIVIAADGTLTKGGKSIGSFSADGMLTLEGMSEKVTYEGPAEAKRALMALFVVSMMTGSEVEDGLSYTKTLSTGFMLTGTTDGIESMLMGFLEDDAMKVDKKTWFNFDRLTFTTGSAQLDMEESETQLTNMAEILKANEAVKLKIGGYTDNTGNAKKNLKLSSERASNVKKALVGLGIAEDRLEAEGYGPEHPVCEANDTEECRAQNRRIAVSVRAK